MIIKHYEKNYNLESNIFSLHFNSFYIEFFKQT